MNVANIKVGTKIQIVAKATRKDGLVEKQTVIVEVKEVTKSYFEWAVVETVEAENVLMPITEGMSMFGNIEFLFTKGGYSFV
jgi:hypothetical protein